MGKKKTAKGHKRIAGGRETRTRREFLVEGGTSLAVARLMAGGSAIMALIGCSNSSGPELCENSCRFARDGDCDDGGEGAMYSLCELGTDCTDCGPRNVSYSDYSVSYSNYSVSYSDYSVSYSDYSDYSDRYYNYPDYDVSYFNYVDG